MTILKICVTALLASVSSGALAADWVVDRARGSVVQWEGGRWTALERGDVVPDARKIRTGADGRADLVRGGERISLSPNTEVAIRDAGDEKMTSVLQNSGTVSIEAERRNVQHFSVQTPVLAAVVKGTLFTVTYGGGVASVSVDRGLVQVQDRVHGVAADVRPGQEAQAGEDVILDVSGPGSSQTIYVVDGVAIRAGDVETAVTEGVEAVVEGTRATANDSDQARVTASEVTDVAGGAAASATGTGASAVAPGRSDASPPGLGGGDPPGLSVADPPGLAGGGPPGLSLDGPPGRSSDGPPGQRPASDNAGGLGLGVSVDTGLGLGLRL